MRDLAGHFGRLAEQRFQFHIDRRVVECRILDTQSLLHRGAADHGEGTALPLADFAKAIDRIGCNRQHIALLRLVAPDFPRRHPWLFAGNGAQVEACTFAASVDQFGKRIRQASCADVMD